MDILEIKDLETLAQKRVPKMFFDYVNSGSWTETTYNENISDFQKIKFHILHFYIYYFSWEYI